MAKTPTFEPYHSENTPMSAGEGGLILLVGGALIGVGYLIGVTRAWKKQLDEKLASAPPRRPSPRNNRNDQKST